MKRLLLLAPALLGASCAKFPGSDSTVVNQPRISFDIQLEGQVNDASVSTSGSYYLYFVAIRAITTQDVPNTGAPIPVDSIGSPNGFVAGSPTHYVVYQSDQPTASYPYKLFRFAPGPGPNDPTNPINLALAFDTTNEAGIGPIVNFTRPADTGNKNELKFDLFLNQLATPQIAAADIKKLQINILTMNVLAKTGAGNRAWDALGDSNNPADITTTITVDLRTNQIQDNSSHIEPTGDVVNGSDPSLDIQNFSIQVTQPQ